MSTDGRKSSAESEISFSYKEETPHTDPLGPRRTFAGLGLLEWLFLGVSTVNILVTIGFTSYVIYYYKNDTLSADFTYAVFLLINSAFCLFYVFNGVLRELTFEVITFACSVLLVLLYVILEYSINRDGRSHIKLYRLIFSCVLAPLDFGLGIKVARQFRWLQFKVAGAIASRQNVYRRQQAFFSLLKFDLQAAVSFFILSRHRESSLFENENISFSVGLALSVVWTVLTWLAIKRQMRKSTWLMAIIGLIEPIFIIAKLIFVGKENVNPNKKIDQLILIPIFIVGIIAFLVRVCLLEEFLFMYKNFSSLTNEQPTEPVSENQANVAEKC